MPHRSESFTVELAQRLVRIESPSHGAAQSDVLDLLADELRSTHELRTAELGGRAIALAAVPRSPSPSTLLFTGHVDVVPVVDAAKWAHPPFGAAVIGDRLWGRGSSDMKAGIAAIVAALRGEPGARAAGLFTTDEETGCEGAAAAASLVADLEIGLIVVAEPTDGAPLRGHKGVTWITVATEGVAAHGSAPHLGDNAILSLGRLLERARTVVDPSWDTVNVGLIAGGSAPNVVPVEAHATIDLRSTEPGTDVVSWWRAQPEAATVSVELDLRPVRLSSGDPLVARLGVEIVDRTAAYFTDAAILADALHCERVLLWGPGDIEQAHRRDESVAVASILAIEREYVRLIDAWVAQS